MLWRIYFAVTWGVINTLRPGQMDAIFQTTFWSAFSWMKMFEFRLRFHWSLFLRVQLTTFDHWLRYKPFSEPMMVSLLTHICVTRPQWVKSYLSRALLRPDILSPIVFTLRNTSRSATARDLLIEKSTWKLKRMVWCTKSAIYSVLI